MGDWQCGVCVRIFRAMADGMERLKGARCPKFPASHHYSPANMTLPCPGWCRASTSAGCRREETTCRELPKEDARRKVIDVISLLTDSLFDLSSAEPKIFEIKFKLTFFRTRFGKAMKKLNRSAHIFPVRDISISNKDQE